MSTLLPVEKRVVHLLPRREPFEVLYRLNCDNLCSDFKEDISFKFSFGIAALINRFMGVKDSRKLGLLGGPLDQVCLAISFLVRMECFWKQVSN